MSILEIVNKKLEKTHYPILPITLSKDLNKSQKRTIKEIENNNLVVVTGSAGTGKTTTIVNVASHFLATNRKVLIVSKNNKAVDVVYNKLDFVSLRCGNKDYRKDLAEMLKNILDNKYKIYDNGMNLFEWLFNKDTQKLLANQQMKRIKNILNDIEKKKKLAIYTKALNSKKKNLLDENFNILLEAFPCICCTTMQISECLPLQDGMFDLVIIDEASQCDIASCLPCLYRAKKALVVGDEKQLKHMSWLEKTKEQSFFIKNNVSEDMQLVWKYRQNSFFDFASFYAEKSILLDTQYRSPSNIMEFSNQEFYNGCIKSHKQAVDLALLKFYVSGQVDKNNCNHAEMREVLALIKNYADSGRTIGVLSPFRNQVDLITKEIAKNFTYEQIKKNEITVSTIEGFQGDEKDIIIASWCVADNSPYQSSTFINNANRFNVAITRAKDTMINLYSTTEIKSDLLKRYLERIK